MVLEKTLETPLESKEIKPVSINPEYSLEGLVLKLKLQYFGSSNTHWRTLLLGKTEGKRRQEQQGMRRMDGITNHLVDISLTKL